MSGITLEPADSGLVPVADGVELFYEVHEPADPGPAIETGTETETILLVMGLATQLLGWPDGFVQRFCEQGFRVVRYDNRDVGLSSRTPGPVPDPVKLLARSVLRQDLSDRAPYSLADMADDAVALLDHLGLGRVHVVGASMGGMIAQELAIHHADRLLSVTSIMSTTGRPGVGGPSREALNVLRSTPPTELEPLIEWSKRNWKILGGPLIDLDEIGERVARSFERGVNPDAAAFHLAAIAGSGNRTKALRRVEVPFLVIHGHADRLVHRSGGRATAKAVRGADLVLLSQMGHDLPEPLWPQIVDAITSRIERVRSGI